MLEMLGEPNVFGNKLKFDGWFPHRELHPIVYFLLLVVYPKK